MKTIFAVCATASIVLTACGGSLSVTPAEPLVSQQAKSDSVPDSSDQTQAGIEQILNGLGEIKDQLVNLRGKTGTAIGKAVSSGPSVKPATLADGSKPTSSSGAGAQTPTSNTKPTNTVVQPPASQAQPSAAEAVAQLTSKILTAPAIQAVVYQSERGLKNGNSTANHLQFYMRGKTVKIDVLASSPRNAGVKLLYTSGTTKVKVRPAGALSFVTTELAQSDERIASNNNYTLSQTDFIGMAERLSQSNCQAELIGKTQVEGKEAYVLKLVTSGTHPLDPAIRYEQVAYDPKTYQMLYWEAYADDAEPFIRYQIKSFEIKSELPNSVFNL